MNWDLIAKHGEDVIVGIILPTVVGLWAVAWITALMGGPILARKIFAAYYEAKLAFLRKSLDITLTLEGGAISPLSERKPH